MATAHHMAPVITVPLTPSAGSLDWELLRDIPVLEWGADGSDAFVYKGEQHGGFPVYVCIPAQVGRLRYTLYRERDAWYCTAMGGTASFERGPDWKGYFVAHHPDGDMNLPPSGLGWSVFPNDDLSTTAGSHHECPFMVTLSPKFRIALSQPIMPAFGEPLPEPFPGYRDLARYHFNEIRRSRDELVRLYRDCQLHSEGASAEDRAALHSAIEDFELAATVAGIEIDEVRKDFLRVDDAELRRRIRTALVEGDTRAEQQRDARIHFEKMSASLHTRHRWWW